MAATYLDRDDLIRVAAHVADRDGWLNLTMSSVAKEVGRHVTSLYGHVDGLDGLRREVRLLALQELGDRCWQAALGKTHHDALVSLLDVYRRYMRDHPGRSEALQAVDVRDPDIARLGRRVAEPFLATLQSYGLDERTARQAQQIISVSVRGFGISEASGRFGSRRSADALFAQLRALFCSALASGTWPTSVR
jgi:AcrR family transcriptional regulator